MSSRPRAAHMGAMNASLPAPEQPSTHHARLLGVPEATLVAAFDAAAQSSIEHNGRESENPLVGSVAMEMALDEMDAEPLPTDFPDTEEGNHEYAEAISQWLDVVDAVAADKAEIVAAVFNATRRVLRGSR